MATSNAMTAGIGLMSAGEGVGYAGSGSPERPGDFGLLAAIMAAVALAVAAAAVFTPHRGK